MVKFAPFLEQHAHQPGRGRSGRATSRALRTALWRRQKGRCYLCGRAMTKPTPIEIRGSSKTALAVMRNTDATVDHRDPLSRGGKNSAANKALACNRCNMLKGSSTEVEFRARWYCFPEDPTFNPEEHLPSLPEPFRKKRARAEAALARKLYSALGEDP